MLVAVTKQKEITKCQRMLVQALQDHLPSNEILTIGFPGGNLSRKVYFNDQLWFSTHRDKYAPVPRYWNSFGIGKRDNAHQVITVEINPPIKGSTKRVAGLFARDDQTGDYVLLHRGKIGGGRKGIGKNAFSAWCNCEWVDVADSNGDIDEAIFVAHLNSQDIISPILFFVHEVASFKDEATSGRLTRTPLKKNRGKEFSPEFHGKKKGYRQKALEYESFHGLVVNKLEEKVRRALRGVNINIFNNRAIDLGVEIGSKLTQIYEVKSSADQQSIYTAIGQLMFHSAGEQKVRKTIVIPYEQAGLSPKATLKLLNIAILEYRIVGKKIRFYD